MNEIKMYRGTYAQEKADKRIALIAGSIAALGILALIYGRTMGFIYHF